MKHNTLVSLSLTLALASLFTGLAYLLLPSPVAAPRALASSTLGVFITFFAICSTLVRLSVAWAESNRKASPRVLGAFKLRSQEAAAVRLLLAQGKANEALSYMQGLSASAKK